MTKKNNEGLVWLYAFVGFLAGLVIGWMLWGRTGIVHASDVIPEFDHADNCQMNCVAWDYKWVCKNYWHSICIKWDKEKYCTKHELVCEPTVTPTPTPAGCGAEENLCDTGFVCQENSCVPVPTATPEATPVPSNPINYNVGAPELPSCVAPIYAPTLTFDNGTFNWTTVKDGLHTYWFSYGPTKDNLPYSVVVQGESFKPNVEWRGQVWAKVAGDSQDCIGPFSVVVDPIF